MNALTPGQGAVCPVSLLYASYAEFSIDQQVADDIMDEGTAPFGWEPQAHLEGATAKQNLELQLDFWRANRHVDPRGSVDFLGGWHDGLG